MVGNELGALLVGVTISTLALAFTGACMFFSVAFFSMGLLVGFFVGVFKGFGSVMQPGFGIVSCAVVGPGRSSSV